MHKIVTAILDRDTNSIRSQLQKKSELKGFKSEASHSIYELAEKTGDYLVLACVCRETQSRIENPETLLYGILATLSNDYFCAQYASGIEYSVWHCLENSGAWPAELDEIYNPIESEVLTDIKYVIDRTGSWYSDDTGVLSVREWLPKYRQAIS